MARSKVGIRVTGKLVWNENKDCWVAVSAEEVDKAHTLAVAADFVVEHYIPDTNPRRFTYKGEEMDLAEFAIVIAHEMGWKGRVSTLYRKLDATLIDAGLRIREYSTRVYNGRSSDGVGRMPNAIREIEG
jgi:hypothetical protein